MIQFYWVYCSDSANGGPVFSLLAEQKSAHRDGAVDVIRCVG
jgi:hypothetical protein